MNYIDKRAHEILRVSDPEEVMSPSYIKLFRIYAVLSFALGKQTSLRDVHDAWSAWRSETNPNHKSLIPFDELSYEVQELDRKYMKAIHACS